MPMHTSHQHKRNKNGFIAFITDMFKVSSFKSKLIEEYFLEISIPYLRKTLKTSLFILILYELFEITYVSVYLYSNTRRLSFGFMVLFIFKFCYVLNSFLQSHSGFIRLSMVSVLLVSVQSILTSSYVANLTEINFTPRMQIMILVFTFIPLNFEAAVIINLLIVIFQFIGTIYRMYVYSTERKNLNNETVKYTEEDLIDIQNFETSNFLKGQMILWLMAFFSGFHMFRCNRIWRRTAFITLGENVQAKRKSKQAMKGQLRWIEAVMPGTVKEEYWQHSADIKNNEWIYIQQFDNVSILFADIVGFTNMSSNKSAPQVVTLLNDLFNRFDELCSITNCEKLGTLGDCYYCVAGCPKPRSDHAISTIEMGLGMVRIIKQFNKDHKENVNMRVGIHTGRVNAAIIGKVRFRFDVYSNDVIIANAMESNGEPGRVHISETSHALVKNSYVFEKGNDLQIKKEEHHGIAGTVLKNRDIRTYFVDPVSSHIKKKSEQFKAKNAEFVVVDVEDDDNKYSGFNSDADGDEEFDDELDDEPNPHIAIKQLTVNKREFANKMKSEVTFIESLRYDPDQQVNCFHNPPIDFFTLMFTEAEIEWHYQNHTKDHIQNTSIFSAKMEPFNETFVCLIGLILITVAIWLYNMTVWETINLVCLGCLLGFTCLLLFIEFFKASTYYGLLIGSFDRYFYTLISTSSYQALLCIYVTIIPQLLVLLATFDCERYAVDYFFQVRYFSLVMFALFNGSLFIATFSPVKIFALTVNYLIAIYICCFLECMNAMDEKITPGYSTCLGFHYENPNVQIFKQNTALYFMQITFTFIVLLSLVRERERNLRIWFYVSREAEIGREEALQQMYLAQDLLYNIIPKYVFDYINVRGGDNIEKTSFNYALAIPHAAVVFACISNFFSKYYREDYKGGYAALKLLNQIISQFDNLLSNRAYKDVEKIKTINDCYMLASGLNPDEVEKNNDKEYHLTALMYYVFDIRKKLDSFNEKYIIGTDKFEIKIGYNTGPVTAGIIGRTKPMYDIWGDTVNVSSRMYSTGNPGEIQVPHYVARGLKLYFKFKYRGKIFVKGKGDMNTFVCLKKCKEKSSIGSISS